MPQQTPNEIVIATANPGKVEEIRRALSSLPVSFLTLNEFHQIIGVEEVGHTYEENASLKAVGYAKQTQRWSLADDSGLEVEALEGKPGLHSARFGGAGVTDQQRTAKLLELLKEASDRRARFVCVMTLAGWPTHQHNDEPHIIHVSEGTCTGTLATQPRGENGFGYDPIFIPDGCDQTFAELSSDIKEQISHRGKALRGMRQFLIDCLAQT